MLSFEGHLEGLATLCTATSRHEMFWLSLHLEIDFLMF